MGKTRDLFKKIGDIEGIFHERMGMLKDRSSKDLTEAEKTKKRSSAHIGHSRTLAASTEGTAH